MNSKPENVFIPKVMTRNPLFLKKGNNPTESTSSFSSTSKIERKKKEFKLINGNIIAQKENI